MAASRSLQNTSSKQHKIVKGIFQLPYKSKNDTVHGNNSDSSEEEEEFDDISLYFGNNNNFVSSKIPKEVKVVIKSENGRSHNCTGKFPLTQMFWQVEALVDSRGFLKRPPAYTIIKDDEIVRKKNLVNIFMSECFSILKGNEKRANAVKACFEAFCQITGEDKNLSFANLENILTQYLRFEKCGCCLGKSTKIIIGNHQQADHSVYIKNHVMGSELGSIVLLSVSHPKLVRTCSQLLPYTFMPFLFRLRDISMTNIVNPTQLIELADEMARERPWEYAFKDILATKLKIYGTETKRQFYEQAGYLEITPQTEKDAIYIYDVLKEDSKRNGNMCIGLKVIRRSNLFERLHYNISSAKRWADALDYLEKNNVIKCEEFNFDRHIFLRENWQAEVDTAKGFDTILKKYKEDPLVWDIDLHSPEFATICKDPDQLRASHLICRLPVTVLSGRGGCGKTTVVTKLLQHLCVKEEARLKEERAKEQLEALNTILLKNTCEFSDTSCEIRGTTCEIRGTTCEIRGTTSGIGGEVSKIEYDLEPQNKCEVSDLNKQGSTISKAEELMPNNSLTAPTNQKFFSKSEKMRKELVSDLVKILENSRKVDDLELIDFKSQFLLTAPTGKAARLLGCKAKLPSATLHSVIMSWRMYSKENTDPEFWKYAGVKVLVVDECSLVSVRLFATVLKILLKKANLQKIILLGDVRQLPSIEPGEFLKDVFKTLHSCGHGEFGLSVELRQNHRSESALIVKNAGKVSHQVMPTFDPAQRFHLIEISDRGDDGERDQKIRGLLRNAQDVTSDVESQFVSFRNAHCKAVNELCCMHYNGHSITTSQTGRRKVRFDFQIGDKICLGKNNLVTNSRRHIIDNYLKEDPEFQKAFKEAKQKLARQDKRSVCTASQRLSGLKLNKTVLDDTTARNLILGNDETFNTTIDKMRKDDLRVEENQAELEKMERCKRAKMKKAEWTAKSSQRPVESMIADESLIGEGSEKLCNGEVFFIMDEFNEVDKNGKHIKYFVLSDRDPELPRVVCVPFQQLKGNCKMKHSWARTIHTYQGSESRTVVYVLGKAMPQNWQHVYTAITRGKNSVYIVGSHAQLLTAITRREPIRFSRLGHRLKEALLQNMECIEMCRQKFITSYQQESTSDFSFDSEQWSESMLLQLEEKVEIEADVSRFKDEKEATPDANLEMTHCDAKDSLICRSPATQSDDANTKMSADVDAGISSDTTLDHEFYDDESELELMMATDKAQMVNEIALNGSLYETELSQCGLQDPNERIGKLSTDVQLSSSANQMISNDPENESSDSEIEYRIFESASRSKARQIKEKLCAPSSSSGPSTLSSAPKRLSLKSSTDFSLSPKHEEPRPYLNVTPPRSSPISPENNGWLTSPPKRACVDTPFRDSFTSSMSLHDHHDGEVEDGEESPLPRKTPNVCRKL